MPAPPISRTQYDGLSHGANEATMTTMFKPTPNTYNIMHAQLRNFGNRNIEDRTPYFHGLSHDANQAIVKKFVQLSQAESITMALHPRTMTTVFENQYQAHRMPCTWSSAVWAIGILNSVAAFERLARSYKSKTLEEKIIHLITTSSKTILMETKVNMHI